MAQRNAIACSAAVSKLFRSSLRSESWLATSMRFSDGSALDSSFVEDLGVDSLDLLQLVTAIEDELRRCDSFTFGVAFITLYG